MSQVGLQQTAIRLIEGEIPDPKSAGLWLRNNPDGRSVTLGWEWNKDRSVRLAQIQRLLGDGGLYTERQGGRLRVQAEPFPGPTAPSDADQGPGVLEVGVTLDGMVNINLPPGVIGHLGFTPDEARGLAFLLFKHAADADGDSLYHRACGIGTFLECGHPLQALAALPGTKNACTCTICMADGGGR